ncbi:kynureninase [Malassezia psittaci]|uniref:Kynureninase n=1 Tax=Malassezia psittaci TaxID=1821823 RepID=A0AAF0JIJ2_9BASI|nr:kynureninase [Malassezia psittaci]
MAPFRLEDFEAELNRLLPSSGPNKYQSVELATILTEKDPLLSLRNEFELPRLSAITGRADIPDDAPAHYFCGNSLGPLAKKSRHYIQEELDVWSKFGVNGHFDHPHNRPWANIDERVARFVAEIVGAKRSEVAVMGSLTQNLHTMLATFYRPNAADAPSQRRKILYEGKAFPSDKYALDSLCRLQGYDPRECLVPIHPREGETYIRTEDIVQIISDVGQEGAMIMLGGVQYFTGQLFELETITKAAHEVGMIVGVDLAHAFMNVPLCLHDWGIDWAVWCSYKYGCAGPGGIAGLFLHEKWNSKNLVHPSGWWGHDRATRFTMPEDYVPIPGAAGWQVSNPSVMDVSILIGALETIHIGVSNANPSHETLSQVGSDKDTLARESLSSLGCGRIMPTLREKSQRLTAYLVLLMGPDGFNLEQYGVKLRLVTPNDPEQRGSQLCIQFLENATLQLKQNTNDTVARSMPGETLLGKIVNILEKESGVVVDVRYPDVLRVAPLPAFNTYKEVHYVVKALASALQQLGSHP